MQTISINLPDALGNFVQQQSAEQGIDEYFERILRDQQREQARDQLEAELIKGIESGFGEPITPEYWAKKRENCNNIWTAVGSRRKVLYLIIPLLWRGGILRSKMTGWWFLMKG